MKSEVKELGDAIVRTHNGKVSFNMGEAAKIINRDRDVIPRLLDEYGILVKDDGRQKQVNAYDLAEVMLTNRVSPIQRKRK